MKLIVILLLLCLAIVGCVNTKRMVLETAYVNAVMNSGKPIEEIRTADLTDDELLTVTHAVSTYNMFVGKWDNPIAAFNNNQLTLIDDFKILKDSYISVYYIVVANWDEYTETEQANFNEWHSHAKEIDEIFNDAVKAKKYMDAAEKAIEYAGIAIGLFVRAATR